MKFHSKRTFLRSMTHNTSIQNQYFTILCLLLAEISMKFYSKGTSLRNMTHNTSIQNLNSTNLCIFVSEISMKIHSKSTSLRYMTHNNKLRFHEFLLIFDKIEYEVSFNRYLLENYDTNHSNSKSQLINLVLILAWNWVWNFI